MKINTSCIQVLDRVRPPEYRSERLAVLNCGMNAWGPLKGGGPHRVKYVKRKTSCIQVTQTLFFISFIKLCHSEYVFACLICFPCPKTNLPLQVTIDTTIENLRCVYGISQLISARTS